MDAELLRQSLSARCPRCHKGALFRSRFSLALRDQCDACRLDLSASDCGDGPAVFLIFILGFLLVPLALLLEKFFHPALWVHAVLWGGVALAITISALRPIKAYTIALQYKHRPGEWTS